MFRTLAVSEEPELSRFGSPTFHYSAGTPMREDRKVSFGAGLILFVMMVSDLLP